MRSERRSDQAIGGRYILVIWSEAGGVSGPIDIIGADSDPISNGELPYKLRSTVQPQAHISGDALGYASDESSGDEGVSTPPLLSPDIPSA